MPGDGLTLRFGTSWAMLLLMGAACARHVTIPEPVREADRCLIAQPPAVAPESLSIAMPAPDARGIAVPALFDPFALMRESLIRVDCTGALVPELAERWEVDSSSHRWTFTIREGAKWANGDPVTSLDVIGAWHSSSAHDASFVHVRDSAHAIDPRRIQVALGDQNAHVLAASELATVDRVPDSDRGYGTGAYGPDGMPRPAESPNEQKAHFPRLDYIHVMPGVDGRDVLERGVDLVFTDDPAVARYASEREDMQVYALPPQRTYIVVTPARIASEDSSEAGLDALRKSLAMDVVQVPSRPSSGPWWWSTRSSCELPQVDATEASSGRLQRVVHRADDPVARAIAERLVSLASRPDDSVVMRHLGTSGGSGARLLAAEALDSADFSQALGAGVRAAFIVSVPARPLAPCAALTELAHAMPWAVHGRAVATGAIVPLIDAGAWAIVRRGAVGIAIDWDGTPRLIFSRAGARDGPP